MATNSNEDISQTENLFSIFYCVSEIYVKFLEYFERKDQSQSLSITEIINFETSSYLNVQKVLFHATLPQTTC